MPSTYNYRYTVQATGSNLAVTGDSYTGAGYTSAGGSTKNAGGTIFNAGTISNGGSRSLNVQPQLGKRAAFQGVTPGYTYTRVSPTVYNSAILFSGAGAGGTLTTGSVDLNRWNVWPALGYSAGAVVGQFAKMVNNNRTVGGSDGGTRGFIIRRVTSQLAVGPLGTEGQAYKLGAGSDYGYRRSILAVSTSGQRTSTLVILTWTAAQYLGPATPTRSDGVNDLPAYTMTVSNQQANNLSGQNNTYTNPASLGTRDMASLPSGVIPGQLVFKSAKLLPVAELYKSKTQV